jgi:hypothetical protein
MIRLLALSCALTLLFAGVIGVLRVQPYRDTIIERIGGCAVSCWKGVLPGEVLSKAMLDQLDAEYGGAAVYSTCFDLPSNFCSHLVWRSSAAPQSTEVMINHDRVEGINVMQHGFTLGEALLALGDFQDGFYSASPPTALNSHFYLQLFFDQTRIGLSVIVPCPTSYLALLQTSVDTVSVSRPSSSLQNQLANTFMDVRKLWYRVCEG